MNHEKTAIAARGKWRGILMAIGIPSEVLTGKHCPCPLCGGNDRFRWDNQEGRGSYICGQCGAGDGMRLSMLFLKQDFLSTAKRIDNLLGNEKFEPDKIKPQITDDDRRKLLRAVWCETSPMVKGDIADLYFASRGVDQFTYPKALRFSPAMRDGEGGIKPCMVALVGVYGSDKYATMHRTFLKRDGSGKAEMPSPRKLMPGPLPDGACVALSEYTGGPLGIAEGIETALAASAMYDLPVWSALNSRMLTKWRPPEGCEEVAIFGDNDPKFAGQAASWVLAHRLALRGVSVTVHIPDAVGADWADEWKAWKARRVAA
jgi:putative DNA primase/helicase